MACDTLNGALELEFLRSGFRARPTEVDVREAQGRYTVGEFQFSEEAGRYIANNHLEAEPVILHIGDAAAYRFYTPPEPISIRRQMDKEPQAKLVLDDATKVLQRGNVENAWGLTNLEILFEYIYEHKDDPNDVITDIQFINEDTAAETLLSFPTPPALYGFDWIIDNLKAPGVDYQMGGIEFKGQSPLDALYMIANEVETEFHVDVNGVLKIGPRKLDSNVYTAGSDNDNINLSRYDVTETTNEVKRIQVTGGFNLKYTERRGTIGSQTKGIKPIAVVEDIGQSGSTINIEAPSVRTLQQAREMAARALVTKIGQNSNGSVVIDAASSTGEQTALGQLHIGDYFIFDEEITEKCEKYVISGLFVVEEIMHRLDPRSGWLITIEVSRIPEPGAFTTKAFYFDPESGQNFQDLESYNEYLSEEANEQVGV